MPHTSLPTFVILRVTGGPHSVPEPEFLDFSDPSNKSHVLRTRQVEVTVFDEIDFRAPKAVPIRLSSLDGPKSQETNLPRPLVEDKRSPL